MTLRDAQMKAVDGLREALKDERPKVYVEPFEGVLSITVAANRFHNTPALLVSPLAVDSERVELAVYFLAASDDRGQISVIDKATEAIRNLSGEDRLPLDVSVKSAYDDNALRSGLRIWVMMASWPHLADGTGAALPVSSEPVADAMRRIQQLLPDDISSTFLEAERRRWLIGHRLPFVTITAEKADFDRSEARRIEGIKELRRYGIAAKGVARWSIAVRCYSASHEEAEGIIWPIVPYIPDTVFDENLFRYTLRVESLEQGEELGACCWQVSCMLEVPAYRIPEAIPSIKNAIVYGKED